MDNRRRQLLAAITVTPFVASAGCSISIGGDDEGDGSPDADSEETTQRSESREQPETEPPSERTARFAPDDIDRQDFFGRAVGTDREGSTVLIGADGETNSNGEGAGTAYVYTRAGDSWSQQAQLTAENGSPDARFGESVALSTDGTTAVVGALEHGNSDGDRTGAAYIFTHGGSSWTQQAQLTADDADPGDAFGESVGVSDDGETAIVGADNDKDPNGQDGGSAYVFTRSGESWSQQAKLTADDGESGDRFGTAVAIAGTGDVVTVGAADHTNSNGEAAGAAYVFARRDGSWSQQATLTATDGTAEDSFGDAVAASENGATAVIGADGSADGAGAAYIFGRTDGSWNQQAKLTADDGDDGDDFGVTAAVSDAGNRIIVGAEKDEDPGGPLAGSAYIFDWSNGSWEQQSKLTTGNGDGNVFFGRSVTVAGDGATAIVGAPLDNNPGSPGSGSVYSFE
jgi:hypothetical protein